MDHLHTDAEGVHRVEHAYVNWYLVEDAGSVTVVDSGHPRSWPLLATALAEIGRSPADVEALVLTHGHFDHVGFARSAHEQLGVPVFAPQRDLGVVAHPWRYEHERSRVPYLARYPGFRRAFAAMAAAGALWVKGLEEVKPFAPGEALDVPGRPLAVGTPGHTFGHCALQLPDRGVVIAGDSVVTFNPYTGAHGPQIVSGAATADSRRALDSLTALAATGAEVVLPGHGPAWRDGAAEIATRALEAGPS